MKRQAVSKTQGKGAEGSRVTKTDGVDDVVERLQDAASRFEARHRALVAEHRSTIESRRDARDVASRLAVLDEEREAYAHDTLTTLSRLINGNLADPAPLVAEVEANGFGRRCADPARALRRAHMRAYRAARHKPSRRRRVDDLMDALASRLGAINGGAAAMIIKAATDSYAALNATVLEPERIDPRYDRLNRRRLDAELGMTWPSRTLKAIGKKAWSLLARLGRRGRA